MKEIWKAFSSKCKAAWEKTVAALTVLLKEFIEEIKELFVKAIDFFKDLIGNILKMLEVIVMSLFVGVLVAFFEAIYDSILYGFDKLKDLLDKAIGK